MIRCIRHLKHYITEIKYMTVHTIKMYYLKISDGPDSVTWEVFAILNRHLLKFSSPGTLQLSKSKDLTLSFQWNIKIINSQNISTMSSLRDR